MKTTATKPERQAHKHLKQKRPSKQGTDIGTGQVSRDQFPAGRGHELLSDWEGAS